MSLSDHLSRPDVAIRFQRLPETDGPPNCLCTVLLRVGFTCALGRYRPGGSLLLPFHPYLSILIRVCQAVYFCCTGLESPPPDVIRHPALRSPDFPHLLPFGNYSRDHLSYLQVFIISYFSKKKELFYLIASAAEVASSSHRSF